MGYNYHQKFQENNVPRRKVDGNDLPNHTSITLHCFFLSKSVSFLEKNVPTFILKMSTGRGDCRGDLLLLFSSRIFIFILVPRIIESTKFKSISTPQPTRLKLFSFHYSRWFSNSSNLCYI